MNKMASCRVGVWHWKVFFSGGLVFLVVLLYSSTGQRDGVVRFIQPFHPANSRSVIAKLQDRSTERNRAEVREGITGQTDVPPVRPREDRRTELPLLLPDEGGINLEETTAAVSGVAGPGTTIVTQASETTGIESAETDFGGYAKIEDLPPKRELSANCNLLFEGDPRELSKALTHQYNEMAGGGKHSLDKLSFADCESFISERRYLTKPVSPEEEEFPLAFGITMYKDPEQAERLLRALYRPQNIYCIHIDKKSSNSVLDIMSKVANCFPNVFLTSKRASVQWGYYSVLEPELHCIDELVKHKKWKYLINLTGQEFPLKTNLDMVKIFKVFQGANDVPGSDFSK